MVTLRGSTSEDYGNIKSGKIIQNISLIKFQGDLQKSCFMMFTPFFFWKKKKNSIYENMSLLDSGLIIILK